MTGVLLLNMGGPDSTEAIRPFLYNLFSDREIIRLGPAFLQKPLAWLISTLRSGHSEKIYAQIGGKSPLPAITQEQASALEAELRSGAGEESFRVYVGMSYWRPFIKDAVMKMADDGIQNIVALTLYPQYSSATTGSAMNRFRAAADELRIKYRCIEAWYDNPLYITALAERIEKGMGGFSERPVVLFSAHSLPQKLIDEGDPYLEQTLLTIEALKEKFEMEWHLSFQSRSGPIKWLEPSTEKMLADLSVTGVKNLLVVPISFVSDHIETLYEIDILYKDLAAKLGINLQRTESLNISPAFIRALADLVITH
jgi:ferrochelatase